MIRKQLFITAEQNRKLKARAAATGLSEGELIRAGIDQELAVQAEKPDWRRIAAGLSSDWAKREHLDEEMQDIRRRWNRRDQLLGRKAKRT
jgi:hypothetical protein